MALFAMLPFWAESAVQVLQSQCLLVHPFSLLLNVYLQLLWVGPSAEHLESPRESLLMSQDLQLAASHRNPTMTT